MMKNKKLKFFMTALALTAVLGLTACSSKKDNNSAAGNTAGVFSTMETADLDGNAVDSTVFSDQKLTLINTWNVGCTPCVEEIPILDQLNDEYADKGVAIKGLYYTVGTELAAEEKEEIKKILDNAGADYQQLTISESMAESSTISGIQAFPTTFIVNSDGEILDTILASDDYDGWKATIEKYLAQVEK